MFSSSDQTGTRKIPLTDCSYKSDLAGDTTIESAAVAPKIRLSLERQHMDFSSSHMGMKIYCQLHTFIKIEQDFFCHKFCARLFSLIIKLAGKT